MTREEREAAVDWFAEQMKAKLREPRNEAKPDWRLDRWADLRRKLVRELNELDEAITYDLGLDAIMGEAVDVANFAMMIADRARLLKG